jgi:5,10-methylenetetrahydromethanopterin reductase
MIQARRSRFDFAFIPAGPFKQTVELVRLGEELGYRCAWLPDQTFHRDPFALLAVCAQATSSIGLGLGITSPYTRLPVQIARAAAAVDEIAGGRFRLGLGTANVDHVLTPLGIAMSNPVGRLRDAISIINRLLAGEQVDFEGAVDHLHRVKLDFSPIRSDIPIYIGTRGPKLLQLAGETSNGVLVESLFNADGMPYVLKNLQIGAARKGRSLSDIDVVAWQVVHITDDVQEAVSAQKKWVARSIKLGPPDAMRRIGIGDEVVRQVTAAVADGDWDSATALVPDEAVKCLMMIGPPEQVSQRISRVFERGASTVSLLLLGSPESHRDNLVRFAREVMPAFC